MPDQVVNYQCPACTGPLHFVGSSGRLECDYCGSTYSVAEIEALYGKKDEKAAEAQASAQAAAQAAEPDEYSGGTPWTELEAEGLRAYNCPSCGAEIVCDANTAATSCVYCGNPSIVPGQVGGMLKPDYVIPFKLDKNAAMDALKRYYKGKRFLPGAFSSGNHIQEIQGVYVPFWLFEGEVQADIQANAIQTETHIRGDDEITETRHFLVERSGSVNFKRVPVDGSSKMPDAHMDAIEPFNYDEMVPFSTAYLPGFLAEKYDVDEQASMPRADLRMENTTLSLLQGTILGYSGVTTTSKEVNIQHRNTKYAMLPVWMLHTKWQNKDYLFAMNGQTGKLIGDLPVSTGKFFAWFAGISVPLMIILAFLTGLIGG